MSLQASLVPILHGSEIRTKNSLEKLFDFKKPKSIAIKKSKIPSSSTFTLNKKNGIPENKIKSELNIFNPHESKKREITILNNYNLNNCFIKNSQEIQSKNDYYYFKANSLEPKFDKYRHLGDFCKIQDFEKHLYKFNDNKHLYNNNLTKIPLISSLFTKNINLENNNICKFPKIKIERNISKSYEPSLLKIQKTINEEFSNSIINIKVISEINIGQKEQSKNNNFNIPDNFLINFNIKEINIQNIVINQIPKKISNSMDFNDAKMFLNNICKKIIINKENNFNSSNGEYIKLNVFSNKEKEKNIDILQRKRKASLDYEEFNDSRSNSCCNGKTNLKKYKYPLKKKYKKNNKKISAKLKKVNKLNNMKEGQKINLCLNQIKINKNNLEHFPFCPIINSKENIRIQFLKGIIEKKNLIKLKKNAELIKDDRNIKYLYNKRFELIYQNKEKNMQYILYINQFNILYIILYYYYQIKEGIYLINKFHYSHAPIIKSKNIIYFVENMIKKHNKIAKEICK